MLAAAGIGAMFLIGTTANAAAGRAGESQWGAPADVQQRVRAAGLSMLSAEGTALHIHQHLTVTVDGKPVVVPAEIGIDVASQQLSAIHTHDPSGIIHVESPEVRDFRLGQVFTEWNVRLATGSIGPYVNGRGGAAVAVFVNQRRYAGDPRNIPLTAHEDIDIVVNHGGRAPAPPARFAWPSGL
jgi:hypothetical protein